MFGSTVSHTKTNATRANTTCGTYSDVEAPIDKFAEGFYKIYQMVRERWNDVSQDPLKTLVFHGLCAYIDFRIQSFGKRIDELSSPCGRTRIKLSYSPCQMMMKLAALLHW